MKNLSQKLKTTLRSRRGEILVESIVSFMILVIIFTGITALTAASLRMIANANSQERERQEEINDAIIGSGSSISSVLTIKSNAADIEVPINIQKATGSSLDVFFPLSPTPTPP